MEFNPYEVILLLLTTIGPLRVTIVCATLTCGAPTAFVRQLAARSVLIATIVCLVFAVLGEAILQVFRVSLPAFQIGGGIIVLLFSLDMAMGKKSEPAEQGEKALSLDLAAHPLAVPLMASTSGLVTIVTLIAQMDKDFMALLILSAEILAIMALNYVCLRYSGIVVRALGPVALQVIGKIMGTILVALAVELIYMGLLRFGLVASPLRG